MIGFCGKVDGWTIHSHEVSESLFGRPSSGEGSSKDGGICEMPRANLRGESGDACPTNPN
jgi:hypothetical protein